MKSLMTVIVMAVTLQIINVSIDPADPDHAPEDLSVNDIESCVEFVVELVLGHADAIKETDEHDGSSCKPHSSHIVLFSSDGRIVFGSQYFEPNRPQTFRDLTSFFESIHRVIIAPPPKVV